MWRHFLFLSPTQGYLSAKSSFAFVYASFVPQLGKGRAFRAHPIGLLLMPRTASRQVAEEPLRKNSQVEKAEKGTD